MVGGLFWGVWGGGADGYLWVFWGVLFFIWELRAGKMMAEVGMGAVSWGDWMDGGLLKCGLGMLDFGKM